jgi:DNA-binding response OmpR family regulator
MTAKHILVVDDDPAMRDMIGSYLSGHGFRISTAADGAGMARVLAQDAVDLIILDLRLTHEDGLDLMRRTAGPSDVPIVVVTGHRRDEADRVVGLELGADDYMTKPFSPRELLARIRAVLRRSEGAERAGHASGRRLRYRFDGWELDMRARRLTSPSGEVVALTAGEFNLLAAFIRSPEQVLSRDQLLSASRVHDDEVYDRSIDVQILRLRRKLEAEPAEPRLIRTERGVGYVFAVPVEEV